MLDLLTPYWNILDTIVLAITAIFFLLIGYRPPWWKSKSIQKCTKTVADIPGPYPFPVLGTRWIFSLGKYDMAKIHECYSDMFDKYGCIMKEEALWNIPVISVRTRKDIETVFRCTSKYPLRPPTEVVAYYRKSRPDRYTSLGLINEQGEEWFKLRNSLTSELVSSKTVSQFVPELNSIVDDFINLIRYEKNANGLVDKTEELADRIGLESSCALILGRRMGFLDVKVDSTSAVLADAISKHFRASRDTFYGLPFWKYFPTKAYNEFVQSEELIYGIVSDFVEKALVDENLTCNTDGMRCIFISILQAPDVDVCEKKAAIIDFIAAGIRTLSNTAIFLLYLIAKHETVQKKLYDEIITVASNKDITANMLHNMPYLRACMMEMFRVLPTANIIARILEADLDLSGYHVQAGTVVLCHVGLACKDESNFKNAGQFDPDRWIGEDKAVTSSAATFLVLPFGVGRRMCPGRRFIEQELQVLLAKLVREFVIEFEGDLELQFEFLLAPKPPVGFVFRDRL